MSGGMAQLVWEHPSYTSNKYKPRFAGFKDEYSTPYPPSDMINSGRASQSTADRNYNRVQERTSAFTSKRPKQFVDTRTALDTLLFVIDNDVAPEHIALGHMDNSVLVRAGTAAADDNHNTAFHNTADFETQGFSFAEECEYPVPLC